jgi:hypothetical protein
MTHMHCTALFDGFFVLLQNHTSLPDLDKPVGCEFQNQKMIAARLKLAVKVHITVGLWLAPAMG